VNVLAVHDAAAAAVARARAGQGPTFIEAPVYRFRAHGGAGDDSRTGYRDEAERQAWETVCPLTLFAGWLERHGTIDRAAIETMEREIAEEIAASFEVALANPSPTEADLYRHVYAD
jgi:pyruvate dehydrogenase E1 component alpha subunit